MHGLGKEIGYSLNFKLQKCWLFQSCIQFTVVFLEGMTCIVAYQVNQCLEFKWLIKPITPVCVLKYCNPPDPGGMPAVSVHGW